MVALRDVWRDAAREAFVHSLFFLPGERRRDLDRRLRGREEARKLSLADAVVVSYGKSGRTWLRVMLSRFWQQRLRLADAPMIEFDNLHRLNPAVPKLLFSHGNYIRDQADEWDTRRHFWTQRTVLLIRDPRDVAVSQYYQWQHRMRPWKKVLNRYPLQATTKLDFVLDPAIGLPAIIDWLAVFEREQAKFRDLMVLSYEGLRADTAGELTRLLTFLGAQPKPDEIADAVEFAKLDNMRAMEAKGGLNFAGIRGRPGDAANPQSFKTRKGKVGGWRDEFSADEIDRIDAYLASRSPLPFGYRLD